MLLLFGVTPKEAMHAFAVHTDTEHQHNVQGPVIDSEHHHCSFLRFQIMPFAAPFTLPLLLEAKLPEHLSFPQLQDERAVQQAVALRESRGPPIA